jgi:hypothetical protein
MGDIATEAAALRAPVKNNGANVGSMTLECAASGRSA